MRVQLWLAMKQDDYELCRLQSQGLKRKFQVPAVEGQWSSIFIFRYLAAGPSGILVRSSFAYSSWTHHE